MSCLDRDSAHWGLSPKMTQRRRILFWNLFVSDVWQVCSFSPLIYFCPDQQHQSLNTGRPPSFSMAYSDCSYPQYGADGTGREADFGTSCTFSIR